MKNGILNENFLFMLMIISFLCAACTWWWMYILFRDSKEFPKELKKNNKELKKERLKK